MTIKLSDLLPLTESSNEMQKMIAALNKRPELVKLAVKSATGKDVEGRLEEAVMSSKLVSKVAAMLLAAGITSSSLDAQDIQSKINNIFSKTDTGPAPVKFIAPSVDHAYGKAASDGAGPAYNQKNVDFSGAGETDDLVSKAAEIIKKFENSKANPRGGYNKEKRLWFPHKSIEGGSDTIAYGHKLQKGEDFSRGITDDQATQLLRKDINSKLGLARKRIKNFDSLPLTVRIAAINALYRGDMGPRTMQHLSNQDFAAAAKEYLNHQEYKNTSSKGVKDRMNWNAKVFVNAD